jgi:hypothetical protein
MALQIIDIDVDEQIHHLGPHLGSRQSPVQLLSLWEAESQFTSLSSQAFT